MGILSSKVVERLSFYRQLLLRFDNAHQSHINSAQLSRHTGATQETIRRDLMLIGCQSVNIRKGYQVHDMIDCISKVLDPFELCRMALVGDNDAITETLLYEYANRHIKLVAVFDFDTVNEAFSRDNMQRFHFDELTDTIRSLDIKLVLLNVPGEFTGKTADILINAGVKGIINLSPVHLESKAIYVENLNIVTAIEKASYFMKWRQYV